jgi:hypothetical protein
MAAPSFTATVKLMRGGAHATFSGVGPLTLASTLESYRAGGLLDLLEDRVCVLSAALPEEIALCLALAAPDLGLRDRLAARSLTPEAAALDVAAATADSLASNPSTEAAPALAQASANPP